MSDTISEVQATFPSDASLQQAMANLSLAGFDRAEISLPLAQPTAAEATPEQGAANPDTREDSAQMRTMGTSLAGSIGAIAAAGLTIATGGAAGVALAAAAAVGVGAAGLAHTASRAGDALQHEDREESARRGELVLAVRTVDPGRREAAIAAMRSAGATRVEPIARSDGQILKEG